MILGSASHETIGVHVPLAVGRPIPNTAVGRPVPNTAVGRPVPNTAFADY